MTESWEDYVDLSGVDATDPSQAVPEISYAVEDFAATVDTVGGVSDLDQVTLDNAVHQTDLAEVQQSWADWHGETAADATTDYNSYVEDASAALATGDLSGAEWSLNQADIAAGTASYAAETAAGYETSTAGYLDAAEGSLDSVDYSGLAADTSSYDSTSYDTSSYDTSATDAGEY